MPSKTRLEALARFGGSPAFAETLHVGRPNLPDRASFLKRLDDVLDRRWLTNNGPCIQQFEAEVARHVGAQHCIAVSSATLGLQVLVKSLGLRGEVIVPSFTFIATPHALLWEGLTPIFCDIDPATHNIDAVAAERLITESTTGILAVHVWGRPCDVEALSTLADRHNLKLIFDAAHAFSCSAQQGMIGNYGAAEVFSFHATKFFNTLEGGAIVTNDDDLAVRLRLMINFGFSGYDRVVSLGINGKMNEVSAAMGLSLFDCMDDLIAANSRNYKQYQADLAGIRGISIVGYDELQRHNHQYVVLEVDPSLTGVTRDQLHEILWAENVAARRYFYPGCHHMEPYRSAPPWSGIELRHTERLAERVLCLPTGTAVGHAEIATIAEIIRLAASRGEEIGVRFAASDDKSVRSVPGAARSLLS
jgi:dTDP-4-amino-4,6-dideoxygalactose transaminase